MLRRLSYLASLLLLLAAAATGGTAAATNYSRVFINGTPVPVRFNDGDSFRVFGGEYRGSQCRLAGFNTLESFGPAHQWGDWHPYELYVNAKMATFNGRRGVWHCRTDGERDTYGRVLMHCPDLIVDQIRRGYAHAYQADDTPSPAPYLRAQQEAIRNRRGMWAHGVPDFIMTSVHSSDEDITRDWHYNRMISTRDGHTESMRHRETYDECSWVCNEEVRVDEDRVRAAARRLREDPRLAPQLTDWFNLHLIEFVSRFRRNGELPEYVPDDLRGPLTAHLTREREAGRLGETHTARGSCMIHVPFERRYGQDRASCLREHGNWGHHEETMGRQGEQE
ncbi:MAG TPA: thermonuclease family protein [Sandaracinaceae bacterium LLY-WYZ-13_1]|nr:thermonuclease family protein [Sandaracinaceae bacterium LLY-WYZ-13_1]